MELRCVLVIVKKNPTAELSHQGQSRSEFPCCLVIDGAGKFASFTVNFVTGFIELVRLLGMNIKKKATHTHTQLGPIT